ncbi:hypothetical protein L1987_20401 [Smallanthus sonchifolius]|uniref:Uncharacterized protein n=1 Tax=Smallanthus sonchifolius TaxID=185202 RepID=A0ACB9IRY1_9ASTR|nr:hypothetical protein L1987_20401 [Smallanthus sonchifolius]
MLDGMIFPIGFGKDTLDLAHHNPRVFGNKKKKKHSRNQFSSNSIQLFDNMLGFTDGETSSDSSVESDSDTGEDGNNGDGGDTENIAKEDLANPIFEQKI